MRNLIQGFKKPGFLASNLCALIIHVVTVAFSIILAFILSAILISVESYPLAIFGILTVPSMYILFAYYFLAPLKKNNFLPVTILSAVLFALAGCLHLLNIISSGEVPGIGSAVGIVVLASNAPSIFIIAAAYSALINPDLYQDFAAFEPLILYLAALLPPLCMYLGLRIKMWRQNKMQKEGEINGLEKGLH